MIAIMALVGTAAAIVVFELGYWTGRWDERRLQRRHRSHDQNTIRFQAKMIQRLLYGARSPERN